MDTLSRDSSSSSNNILPLAAIALGVIGLLVGIIGLVKATKLEKSVAAQMETVNNSITSVQTEERGIAANVDNSIKTFRDSVQGVLTQVGNELGTVKAQITRLEEAAKKPAPVAGKAGKGGGKVTGTVDADGNYLVAPGDTLNKIAKKFGTTKDAIEAENPGIDPAKLRVGQKVKIPKK